jgi:hypothetical protein
LGQTPRTFLSQQAFLSVFQTSLRRQFTFKVSAKDVKKIRDETGAPLIECKKALEKFEGDMTQAKALLRERHFHAAGKKADNESNISVYGKNSLYSTRNRRDVNPRFKIGDFGKVYLRD